MGVDPVPLGVSIRSPYAVLVRQRQTPEHRVFVSASARATVSLDSARIRNGSSPLFQAAVLYRRSFLGGAPPVQGPCDRFGRTGVVNVC